MLTKDIRTKACDLGFEPDTEPHAAIVHRFDDRRQTIRKFFAVNDPISEVVLPLRRGSRAFMPVGIDDKCLAADFGGGRD